MFQSTRRLAQHLAIFGILGGTANIAIAQDEDPSESPEVEGLNYHGEPLPLPTVDSPYRAEAVDLPELEDAVAPRYWTIAPTGFVRTGYNWLIGGDRNGFELVNARVGVRGIHEPSGISFKISADAAVARRSNTEDSTTLNVALKDAWLAFYPNEVLGLQIGQFKAPFTGEGLRSRTELLFITRAVGRSGIPLPAGLDQQTHGYGREVGAMIAAPQTMWFGDFGLHYAVMLANGNGENQIANDNNIPAVFGRVELSWTELIRLSGGFAWNRRTLVETDVLVESTDVSFSTDLLITWEGLEFYTQFIHTATSEEDSAESADGRSEFHAQAGYEVVRKEVGLTPAYRFVYQEVDVAAGTPGPQNVELMHHTVALRMRKEIDPVELRGFLEYTHTTAPNGEVADQDSLRMLLQLAY